MHRRAGDRRRGLQIVAERGAEGGLVARRHRQRVDQRRPDLLVAVAGTGEVSASISALRRAAASAPRSACRARRLGLPAARRAASRLPRLRRFSARLAAAYPRLRRGARAAISDSSLAISACSRSRSRRFGRALAQALEARGQVVVGGATARTARASPAATFCRSRASISVSCDLAATSAARRAPLRVAAPRRRLDLGARDRSRSSAMPATRLGGVRHLARLALGVGGDVCTSCALGVRHAAGRRAPLLVELRRARWSGAAARRRLPPPPGAGRAAPLRLRPAAVAATAARRGEGDDQALGTASQAPRPHFSALLGIASTAGGTGSLPARRIWSCRLR